MTTPLAHADNEVVVNSEHHNQALPDAVEAFFYMHGQSSLTDLGYGNVINVPEAHQAFLDEYQLDATQVPLLEFNPMDWQTPFADVSRSGDES